MPFFAGVCSEAFPETVQKPPGLRFCIPNRGQNHRKPVWKAFQKRMDFESVWTPKGMPKWSPKIVFFEILGSLGYVRAVQVPWEDFVISRAARAVPNASELLFVAMDVYGQLRRIIFMEAARLLASLLFSSLLFSSLLS